jgi:hypothetical protein
MNTNLEIYPEYCCEICNDIIHNHFNCPACKTQYAGTDAFYDLAYADVGDEIECQKCHAVFRLDIKVKDWELDTWLWEQIKTA